MPRQDITLSIKKYVKAHYIELAIFAWFIFQAIWIALSTKPGIPPDENFHMKLIRLYSERSFDPFLDNQEGYFVLGDVIRNPSILYHYLLSWPYRLLSNFENIYIWFRFFNIALAVASLYMVKRIGETLNLSRTAINLSIFMLANTLMFVFLSASVNYDNLIILLSLASFNLLLALFKRIKPKTFLLLLSVILGGVLVKLAFLPLAILEVGALLIWYRKSIFSQFKSIYTSIITKKFVTRNMALLVVFLLLIIIAVERFGLNYAQYGKLLPACTQVHAIEECRNSAIFRRGESIKQMNLQPEFGLKQFIPKWVEAMKRKTYGIMGHKSTGETPFIKYGVWLIAALMLIAVVTKFDKKEVPINYLLLIGVTYVSILLYVNFSTYMRTGLYGLALQGRYAFPVLPVLYLVGNFYVARLLTKKKLIPLYAIFVIGVFITAGLPSYIYLTDASWHNDFMVEINRTIKDLMQSAFN